MNSTNLIKPPSTKTNKMHHSTQRCHCSIKKLAVFIINVSILISIRDFWLFETSLSSKRLDSKNVIHHFLSLDSQINEIDALLSELNQLQTTLEYTTDAQQQQQQQQEPKSDFLMSEYQLQSHYYQAPQLFMSPYMSASSQFSCYNNVVYEGNEDNVDAIDQQFDEVLKFLAQSIDGSDKYNTGSVCLFMNWEMKTLYFLNILFYTLL